jgi:hypothetical protein
MYPSILQQAGSSPTKQPKYTPLTTLSWFSGLVTQRSPFSPYSSRSEFRYLGGRPDMLIDGLNVELNNIGTLQRRPGLTLFSSANLGSAPLTFYSFHPPSSSNNPITIIADTATNVYTLTTSSKTSILTKANGAGQSYFQGVGTTLYIGDGIDLQAWPGTGVTRNWGIVMNNTASTVGPNGCGTGTDVSVPGSVWINPGNITADDGSFATVSLAAPTAGSSSQGPNACGTAANVVSGPGNNWVNPTNIEINDGNPASVFLNAIAISQSLQGTNFGFGIPANATINGITVVIKKSSFDGNIEDFQVKLIKGGSLSGTDKANTGTEVVIGGGFSNFTYGGPADMWGNTFTPADINASNFGIGYRAQAPSPSGVDVDFVSIIVTFTVPVGLTTVTDLLNATNFGFALSTANTISGILIEIKGVGNAQPAGASLTVSIVTNGVNSGTPKTGIVLNNTDTFISLGSSADLWGGSFSAGDINNVNFGISIQGTNSGSGTGQWSVDFVRITVFGTGGPTIAVSGAAGTFSATAGYKYVFAYGNSASGTISNSTPPSASTGIFTNKLNVSIALTASTDPQVNQIRLFRTKDGGSTFFELPTSPYSNTSTSVLDNAPDSSLNLFSFFLVSPSFENSPPPAGLINLTYHLNRIWGSVGNFVFYAGGPDTLLGNGNEAFPPENVFSFPSPVKKLVPISNGLLVFTTDDTWIVVGTTTSTFYSMIYQEGLGILSWNALDISGSNIFIYTSDKQFLVGTASGLNEIGFAIGDQLEANYNPSTVYVASLISGTRDKAVFIEDGIGNWFRCNWNQPPEGGPAWSPQASIVGGASAVVSVETSPGVHQLFVGQNNGTVLVRNLSTFTDNGSNYSAFLTIGSLVLAQPGQLAEVSSINLELQKVGSVPSVGILLDEIAGGFETLNNSVDSPAVLTPSKTVFSKRFDLAQGNDAALCRHMQVKVSFPTESFKNELLTLSIFGKLMYEE